MYCRRCYVRYVLRTVSTADAAVFLPFYAATLWVIATPCTPRVFINKPNSIKGAGNYPAFCGTHIPTLNFPPSTFSHHHPPPASRHNRWTPRSVPRPRSRPQRPSIRRRRRKKLSASYQRPLSTSPSWPGNASGGPSVVAASTWRMVMRQGAGGGV